MIITYYDTDTVKNRVVDLYLNEHYTVEYFKEQIKGQKLCRCLDVFKKKSVKLPKEVKREIKHIVKSTYSNGNIFYQGYNKTIWF